MKVFDIGKDPFDYEFTYHLDEKDKIKKAISNMGDINIDDIRRIALWKYDRIVEIDNTFLSQLYRMISKPDISIDDEEVQSMIRKLVSCNGVGFPLASSILKFINPDVFPIIDVRAYRAIFGKKLYYNQYNLKKYIEYVKRVYDIRDQLQISLSDVDEKLYMFDKEHNGKI